MRRRRSRTLFIWWRAVKAGWTRNQTGANKWNELVERKKLVIYDSTIPLWILAVYLCTMMMMCQTQSNTKKPPASLMFSEDLIESMTETEWLSGVRCFVLFTLILKQLVLLCLVSFVFVCSVTHTCLCFYMTAVYLLYIAFFLDCNVSFLACFVWNNSSNTVLVALY